MINIIIWWSSCKRVYKTSKKSALLYLNKKICAEPGALLLRKTWLLPADHVLNQCFMPWTACLQVLGRISSPLVHGLAWLLCLVTFLFPGNLGDCSEDCRGDLLCYFIGTKLAQTHAPTIGKWTDPTRSGITKESPPGQTGRGPLVLFQPIFIAWDMG